MYYRLPVVRHEKRCEKQVESKLTKGAALRHPFILCRRMQQPSCFLEKKTKRHRLLRQFLGWINNERSEKRKMVCSCKKSRF